MLLAATLAITPIACAVPVFGGRFFNGELSFATDEPGRDLAESGLGPATSRPEEPCLGVRGVRALLGGVGPAGPDGVRPGTAKLRRAAMEWLLAVDARDGWPLAEPDEPGRTSGVGTSRDTGRAETGREPAVCRSSSSRLLSKSWWKVEVRGKGGSEG